MGHHFKELGMHKSIPRRDFLNGVAMGLSAGSLAEVEGTASNPAEQPDEEATGYPPLRANLRGNIPSALAEFNHIRAGEYTEFPVAESNIDENFDLVVVGGGISGLAAAHFYRTALGSEQRILILDNHDDFGGHAKRNEFHHEGRTFIGYGGTMAIATPYPYSYAAKSLIRELGIDVTRNSSIRNQVLDQYDLHHATFFDKEHFGEDRVVAGNPHQISFFSKTPLS
jgi:spermidine dehydrogenase